MEVNYINLVIEKGSKSLASKMLALRNDGLFP